MSVKQMPLETVYGNEVKRAEPANPPKQRVTRASETRDAFRKASRGTGTKSPALAGRAHAGVGELRPSDALGIRGDVSGRRELRAGTLESRGPAFGDALSRAQLVWRQPGRNNRAREKPPAPALRILRRPHDRLDWRAAPDGRSWRASGYLDERIAMGMLAAFLLLSIETYLATYTMGTFRMSFWIFGPTEIRILLAMGNIALWLRPDARVPRLGYRLFDFGGIVAIAGMGAMLAIAAARHTAQLYREETRP